MITIEGGQDFLYRSAKLHENIYKIYNGSLSPDSLDTRMMRRVTITKPVVDINYPNLASKVIDQNVKLEVLEYYQTLARWKEYLEEYNQFIRRRMRPFLGEMQFQNYDSQYSDETNNINKEKLIEELGNPKVQQMFFEAAQRSSGDWTCKTVMKKQGELKIAIEKVIR